MKLICTGDWHLGNLFHGIDRLAEHRHFLNWLLERIRELRPDALLVAGDVFDNGNPSAAAQNEYYRFLAELSNYCPGTQVVITAGNHDSARRLEAPRPFLSRHNIEIRGCVERDVTADAEGNPQWEPRYDDLVIPVDGADGTRIAVLAVPFLRSDIVRGESYSKGVNDFLEALTAYARTAYPDRRIVMMAHLYASGAEIAGRDASEKILIGGQEQVAVTDFEGHPDHFTCGHIHKRQGIRGTTWARYTGSVLPMSFAEKNYTHGVDLVTITGDAAPTVELLEYYPTHPLVEIPEDDSTPTLKGLLRLINAILPEKIGKNPDESAPYVTLKVRFDRISNDDIHTLENAVAARNAILCKIHKLMTVAETEGEETCERMQSIDEIINRDPMEIIGKAFTLRHGKDLSESQQTLLNEVIRDIENQENWLQTL